jgi:hypothetical protein
MLKTAPKGLVERVEVPIGSIVAGIYPKADYADAYRLRVPVEMSLEEITRQFLPTSPGWLVYLLKLRNLLVTPFGLKTGREVKGQRHATPLILESGRRIGLFRVFTRTADEIVLGEDDRHLNFRVSVLRQPQGEFAWATFSTVVRFNGWLGRAYFVPVRPLHRLIVPAMLKHNVL